MAWLDELFARMVTEGASDLHLTTGLVPKFRLNGEIIDVPGAPVLDEARMREVLDEITPAHDREQFEREWDTDFAYELPGEARFRANLFMDRTGPGAVFRQIPVEILSVQELGLPPIVLELCRLSKGLVLVTGPTGSGKSTTLAAMIDHINRTRGEHVITIEDPIEFVHQPRRCLINQREVHRHTESFKRALRAALREDPDIVLVGEMRDLETIEIAIETAETGHLVFGTLHTTTAPSTVDRIIDQFPAGRQAQIRTMLASSLKGVVAQTLCKRQPTGRVAALEILTGTTAVAANIREGKTHQIVSAMQMGRKHGMRLLNDSLLELVQAGTVDPMEAYFKAVHKEDMRAKLESIGASVDLGAIGAATDEAPADVGAASNGHAAPAQNGHGAPPAALPSRTPSSKSLPPVTGAGSPPAKGWTDPFDTFKRERH